MVGFNLMFGDDKLGLVKRILKGHGFSWQECLCKISAQMGGHWSWPSFTMETS